MQRPRRAQPEVPAGPARLPALRASVHRAVAAHRALPARSRRRRPRAHGADLQRRRHRSASGRRAAGAPRCRVRPSRPASTGWSARVGRLQAIKNQTLLARAFVRALELSPAACARMRLVMAGEGPLRAEVEAVLRECGVADQAWLAGARNDVPEVLRGLDAFVLPSLAEGISNTILEAMASALPVVATRVGGNPELLDDGVTGRLVPVAGRRGPGACAARRLRASRRLRRARGRAARAQVEEPLQPRRHGARPTASSTSSSCSPRRPRVSAAASTA